MNSFIHLSWAQKPVRFIKLVCWAGMEIGKSVWGVLTSLGWGPGAAQALVGCRGNAPCQEVWGPDADAKLSFKG